MQVGSITSGNVASAVWSASIRGLTTMGGAVIQAVNQNGAIAGGTTGTFSTSSGRTNFMTMALKAGAAGTAVQQYYDGTNTFTAQTITAGNQALLPILLNTSAVYSKVQNNDGTNAIIVCFTILVFQ